MYRTDRQYGVKRLKGKFSTDTLGEESKSLRSNATTQVYSHNCGVTTVYHMNKANNENIRYIIGAFISEFGVPEHLPFDGAAV